MRRAILVFPDVSSLTSFVFDQRISGMEITTWERKVNGTFSEQQIVLACTKYKAELVKKIGNSLWE